MNKPILFAAIAAAAFFCTTAGMAQYSGTAAGQNPAGNSNFGGGNSSSGDFTTYAAATRALHEERYDEAVAYFQQLLQTRPRSPDVLDKLGFAQTKTRDYTSAQASLQRALSIDPDSKPAHRDLGELDLATFNVDAANGQLAELNRLCSDGCDEKDALSKAIADYHASGHTPPPAAPPAPAH